MKKHEQIAAMLDLDPLEGEGGVFRRTYSSPEMANENHMGSAIYYFLSGEAFSFLHKLPTDEIYHFYSGDPVLLVELFEDGTSRKTILGPDILNGHKVQHIVEAGVWQGSYLLDGSDYALMGTTMSPGFQDSDYIPADRKELINQYPNEKEEIIRLTEEIKFY